MLLLLLLLLLLLRWRRGPTQDIRHFGHVGLGSVHLLVQHRCPPGPFETEGLSPSTFGLLELGLGRLASHSLSILHLGILGVR